jgi:hypothetical protein
MVRFELSIHIGPSENLTGCYHYIAGAPGGKPLGVFGCDSLGFSGFFLFLLGHAPLELVVSICEIVQYSVIYPDSSKTR